MNRSEHVWDYLTARRGEMLDFLAQLVQAESPSTQPEAQAMPLTILTEALLDLGFEVDHVPGQRTGGYLVGCMENGRFAAPTAIEKQLLIGHCDTVWPLGTLREMPFQIDGNVVRGPGVYDMKGGLTQMIFALRALCELEYPPAYTPVVLVNSDEEIGSIESRAEIMRQAEDAERAFVLEPALGLSGKLKTARKGVGRFEITVRGKAAHAGLDPEKGRSAVLALALLVQQLFELNDLAHGVSVNVGTINGGTQTNVIAPEASATVDVRVPTVEDAQRLEQAILALQPPLPGTELDIRGGFNRLPLERTPRNQALWQQARALGETFGLELEEGAAGGGSDGNYTSRYTATLDGLGAVGDGAHARHEFVYIDKMIERTALLAALLMAPA